MSDTTDTPVTTEALTTLVDRLEADFTYHVGEAARIRQTLDDLRKRLASARGARAGKNARSGKRRPRSAAHALPYDGTTATEASS